jgi:hypothetical protein
LVETPICLSLFFLSLSSDLILVFMWRVSLRVLRAACSLALALVLALAAGRSALQAATGMIKASCWLLYPPLPSNIDQPRGNKSPFFFYSEVVSIHSKADKAVADVTPKASTLAPTSMPLEPLRAALPKSFLYLHTTHLQRYLIASRLQWLPGERPNKSVSLPGQ